jgi:hypothetical protein
MVFGSTAKIGPVAALWNLERVKVGGGFIVNVFAELLDRLFLLFVPRVREALKEEKRKDEVT